MEKNKEQIDDLIKQSLNEEEAKFYDDLEEQNFIHKLGGLFQGKMAWLVVLMNIVNLVVFGISIYCVIQFVNLEETNALIKWGAAILACYSTLSMIKVYMWMQMDKNTILRELKRLELQVAALSSKK